MKNLIFALAKLLASLLLALAAIPALAQSLTPGTYHWYVPEHERYGRTQFFSQPAFESGMVRVTRTQRFKLIGAAKGWAMIQFDVAGKAYIHLRILRNLVFDPTVNDPWHEFQRASVFAEEPAKIEARLKSSTVSATPDAPDSKLPAWKRYKDAWGLKSGRQPPTADPDESGADPPRTTTARPGQGSTSGKPRNKHPLLPPIGSEPPQEATPSDIPERQSETPAR